MKRINQIIPLILFFVVIVGTAVTVFADDGITVEPRVLPDNFFQYPKNATDNIISPGLLLKSKASLNGTILIDSQDVDSQLRKIRKDHTEQKKKMVGVHVNAPAYTAGNWEQLATAAGLQSLRIAFKSKGATFLRLNFLNYPVLENEKLIVYGDPDKGQAFEVKPHQANGSGSFWGPPVEGDVIHLELISDAKTPPGIQIDRISVGFEKLSNDTKESWCYFDPNCYSQWSSLKSGIGQMVFSSGWAEYVCTGSVVMDTAETFSPWFLTANHCINNQNEASSLVVTWDFETTSCNGTVPNFWGLPRSNGAQLKFSNMYFDESLLLLNEPPPQNTAYLGWTTEQLVTNEEITVIHHPGGAYKRISFGYMTELFGPYWNVRYYESPTEGGSSGSPLFNDEKLVVGTLTSGLSACNALWGKDNYGRFEGAWFAGMSDFLSNGNPPPPGDDDDNGGTDDDDGDDDDENTYQEGEEYVPGNSDNEDEDSSFCGC